MAHDIIATEAENRGSLATVFAVLDITALDAAGTENFDPAAELGITGASGRFGIDVRAQADNTYRLTWDHVAGELAVQNVADGTDVANDTAVGEVMLEVTGV